MHRLISLMLAFGSVAVLCPAANKRILVYTRNYTPDGKGYVHENIATSVETIKKLGAEHGFNVDSSDDPKLFTPVNLKKYAALVFSNSNNEAFENDEQRAAFKAYVEGGGGFVGIHSATGSERKWPDYWNIIGGHFLRHPKLQKFTVRVKEPKHPATKNLPATFEWEDECYYTDNLAPDLHVLLVTDPAKLEDPQKAQYPGDRFGDSLPLSWSHEVGKGRAFYTALGHKKEHYSNPLLVKQILGGIQWTARIK